MPLMVQIEVTGMTKLSDRQKRTIRREIVDFSFVLPALVVFVLVIILPLISGIRYTFTDWNGMAKQINFVGLKNYSTVLHDKDLIKPIVNTGLYTLITTVVINILGLTLAMMVTREFKGVNVIKSIVFIPLVVSLVLVSYMWMYVYSDFFGMMGLESPLIKEKTVIIGLCAMAVWKEVGLAMMISGSTKGCLLRLLRGGNDRRSRILGEVPAYYNPHDCSGIYLLHSVLDCRRIENV